MALAPYNPAQLGQTHRAMFDERPEGPTTTPSTSSARFRLGGLSLVVPIKRSSLYCTTCAGHQ